MDADVPLGPRLARLVARRTDRAAARGLRRPTRRATSVVAAAGSTLRPGAVAPHLGAVERSRGDRGTDFGVPSRDRDADRRRVDVAEAAGWPRWSRRLDVFDRVAAGAPVELRKGPAAAAATPPDRRPRRRADHAYAREIGIRAPDAVARRPDRREAERAAMLEVLRRPSDGSPLAGPPLDRPLRRPPDRLARPRPRLGDRGPLRARLIRRARRRQSSRVAIPLLERPRRLDQPPVDRKEVLLGDRPLVGHRRPGAGPRARALDRGRRASPARLLAPDLPAQLGPLVQERRRSRRSSSSISRRAAEPRRARSPSRGASSSAIAPARTVGRSPRGPGGSRARPARRYERARCPRGS